MQIAVVNRACALFAGAERCVINWLANFVRQGSYIIYPDTRRGVTNHRDSQSWYLVFSSSGKSEERAYPYTTIHALVVNQITYLTFSYAQLRDCDAPGQLNGPPDRMVYLGY